MFCASSKSQRTSVANAGSASAKSNGRWRNLSVCRKCCLRLCRRPRDEADTTSATFITNAMLSGTAVTDDECGEKERRSEQELLNTLTVWIRVTNEMLDGHDTMMTTTTMGMDD